MFKDISDALMGECSIGFDQGLRADDIEWYSTGSKSLDMQLNGGRLDRGGIPSGKLTIFSGLKSCGKTYFAMKAAIDFMSKVERGYVFFFDSEYNVTVDTFVNAGMPEEFGPRLVIIRVNTMEEFRTKIVRIFQTIESKKKSDVRAFVILDSVGGLIPQKAYDEANAAPNAKGVAEVKASMGRPQQVIKEFTKIAVHEGGKLNVPIIFVSHVYKDNNAPNPKYAGNIVSGGEGLYYFNSNLVEFSRRKSKDDKVENKTQHDVNGILVTSKLVKSRFAREETKVLSLIHFNLGVIPTYGFVSMAEQAGLVQKKGLRFFSEKWGEKCYSLRQINSDQTLMEPLMTELQKWTIAQFGLGKMSLSTADALDFTENSTKINFENVMDEEDPDHEETDETEDFEIDSPE